MFKKHFSTSLNIGRILLCLKTYLGIQLPENTIVHTCSYDNERVLEAKLNELCEHIFGATRKVHFNSFRGFPYLEHTTFSCNGVSCTEDAAGKLIHYTEHDFWFLWVVKQFLQRNKNGTYVFIDIDWLKETAIQVSRPEDRPISEMHADYLFW